MKDSAVSRRLLETLSPWLSGLRSRARPRGVRFDAQEGVYESTQVVRGFPVGGIGAGGLGVGSAGGFCDWRANNNWMRPIRVLKGSFLALSTTAASRGRDTRILRLGVPGGEAREYENARPPGSTRFRGDLPFFELSYPDLYPLRVTLEGFTPLVPHDTDRSSLPLVWLTTTLRSVSDEPVTAALAFSFENVLGRGGTGQTGIVMERGLVPLLNGRLCYDDVSQNHQQLTSVGDLRGLSFRSDLQVDPRSHQASTLGELLLLVDERVLGLELSYARSWDASRDSAVILDELEREGRLSADESAPTRPAGAVCAHLTVPPRQERTLSWVLAWWTPDHVTEERLITAHASGRHDGVHVGHHYAARFSSPHALVKQAHEEREELERKTRAPLELLQQTTLPSWLVRALTAAADTALVNTLLPKDGRLYTLESAGWKWPFGGLAGTNDQRLSAHPYMQTFFPKLDVTELDTFACHTVDGEVPHGIGNCDTGLDTCEVPYGKPLSLGPFLQQEPWPDLTLSWILQAYRSTTLTGDDGLFVRHWPKVKDMVAFLARATKDGVPEGGSTYDTFRFPGTFSYTATLSLAAYKALIDVAGRLEPSLVPALERMRDAARARIDAALWDPRGFFRTSPRRDTLFFGSLAGEWMARRCGLGPLLPLSRTQAHVANAHRVLVKRRQQGVHALLNRAPFIHSEARYDGRPKRMYLAGFEVFAYAWQVVSYHALLAFHVGLVEEGLEALQILYSRIWSGGYPWSADLYGNPGGHYMTHPALWALPDALTGVVLHAREGVLELAPRPLPDGGDVQRLPVFQPRFWGLLEVSRTTDDIALHVTHTFGDPVVVRRIEHVSGDERRVLSDEERTLRPGTTVRLKR